MISIRCQCCAQNCQADPRWYSALAPYVHELTSPKAEDPLLWAYPGSSNLVAARTLGRIGTRVLLRMARKDLFTRADWEAFPTSLSKTNCYSSRELSAEI